MGSRLSAADAVIEHLGQPCRAKNILSGRVVTEPGSGRELLVLANSSEASNMELLIIDPLKNEGRVARAPKGQGAWVLQPVPGDRLVVGTYYDGQYMVFDLASMQFTNMIGVPGEQYLFCAALTSEGRVYAGTYPGAKLAALDTKAMTLKTWNNPAKPNMYLRWMTATADGRLLCTYGMGEQKTLIFDPKSEQFLPAPEPLQKLQATTVWNNYIIAGDKVFDAVTLKPVEPLPFPLPTDSKTSWTAINLLTTSDTLYLKQERNIYSVRAGDKNLEKVLEIDSRLSGGLRGVLRDGTFVGSYGQDYYVGRQGAEPELRAMPVESAGRPPHFIRPDGKGKLWGGPWFGQTLFHIELATSKTVNTGIVSHRGGEVYDVAFHDGKVYAVAYVGGEVIEYDPAKPFDLWKGNPRTIASVGGKYIRPNAGITLGLDGKLYSGWMAQYGTYGGCVAITNPEDGKTSTIENPLGEVPITGIAVKGERIYIGSGIGGNGLPAKPGTRGCFGILDRNSGKLQLKHEFEQTTCTNIHDMFHDAATDSVVMQAGRKIFVYRDGDQAPRETKLPQTSGELRGDGRGNVYYAAGYELVVADLKSEKVTRNAKLPGKVEKVGVDADGTVFVSSGADIYRVRFP